MTERYYSGINSTTFWAQVNALDDKNGRLLELALILQEAEGKVLKIIGEREAQMRQTNIMTKTGISYEDPPKRKKRKQDKE